MKKTSRGSESAVSERKSAYICPHCGMPATRVWRTISFNNCIIRFRRCENCGRDHETTEMNLNNTKIWNEMAAILMGRIS